MSNIGKELRTAVLSEIGSRGMVDTPNISYFAIALKTELISNIQGADMPGAAKNALINSVSVAILSETHAVISLSAMRPSIYGNSSVDLALIFDQRKRIKPTAVYIDEHVFIPIGRLEGWSRPYSNNYLQKTASGFMASHPDCIVSVSK